jgi:hypothetical protein
LGGQAAIRGSLRFGRHKTGIEALVKREITSLWAVGKSHPSDCRSGAADFLK